MADAQEQIGQARKFKRGSYGVVCDRGLNPKRLVNEDSCLVLEDACLFAVADGVGGQNAGEVASQTAMEFLRHHFSQRTRSDRARSLEQLVAHINSYLYELSIEEDELSGMATTLALVLFESKSAIICHVGDSRVYSLTSGRLHRETIDHSLAEYERLSGLSILEYPKRNVITRALGVDFGVGPDVKKIALQSNMIFLLCTDGITRHVSDPEIEEILIEESDPQKACDRLKEVCFERGARDNLTAIIVHLDSLSARRGRALTESEQSEPRAAETPESELSARLAGIQAPLMSEEESARPAVHRSELTESEGGSASVLIEPRAETARSRFDLRKNLAPILIAVVASLLVFVAGLSMGRWLGESKAIESTSTTGGTTASKEEAHVSFDQGMREFNRGSYEQAQSSFAHAVTLDRSNSVYCHWLGRAQMAAGKYAEAAQNFLLALQWGGAKDNLLFASAAFEAAGDRTRADELIKTYIETQSKAP